MVENLVLHGGQYSLDRFFVLEKHGGQYCLDKNYYILKYMSVKQANLIGHVSKCMFAMQIIEAYFIITS